VLLLRIGGCESTPHHRRSAGAASNTDRGGRDACINRRL